MTELKPCPFCGARFEIVRGPEMFAKCEGCGVTTRGRSLEASVIADVNTRPAPAQAGEGKLPPNLVAWRGECAKRDEHGTVFDSDIVSLIDRLEAALSTPPPDARLREAVELAVAEFEKATRKFPTWPTDPLHALSVLGEEFGELTKEMLQSVYEPHKTNRDKVRTEAIQTAAMSLRLLVSLGRYEYTPGPQHSQAALQSAPAPSEEGERAFRVLGAEKYNCPASVPWSALNEEWAQKNHSQSLKRLNERGGLSPSEIWCNVNRKPLRPMPSVSMGLDCVRSLQPAAPATDGEGRRG